jgi:catechol 2,3-dioxygenase-like lactoylglutathione lyase family enzyme
VRRARAGRSARQLAPVRRRRLRLPVADYSDLVPSDLETSERFYRELFGLEPIPTPNFGIPVRWLRVGDLQLHLFQREGEPGRHQHLALAVHDFPALYREAEARGIFDTETFGHHLHHLPGDVAQLYLRDPADNLIEVDSGSASTLPEEIRREMRPLRYPQDAENERATLFLDPR